MNQLIKDTLLFLKDLESYEEISAFFQQAPTKIALPILHSKKVLKKISLPPPKKFPISSSKILPKKSSEQPSFLKEKNVQMEKRKEPNPPLVEEKKTFFKLEPFTQFPPLLFEEMRSLFHKFSPHLSLHSNLPDDISAKRIKEAWKMRGEIPDVVILLFDEKDKKKEFLKNLAKAIDIRIGFSKTVDASKIEKELLLKAKNVKLIIAVEDSLIRDREWMKHYKEYPSSHKKTLQEVPLFLLPDLTFYFKDPLLKSSLWKALCSQL